MYLCEAILYVCYVSVTATKKSQSLVQFANIKMQTLRRWVVMAGGYMKGITEIFTMHHNQYM